MMEEPIIIQMNVTRYEAMLKLDLDGEKRTVIKRLLAESRACLVLATDLRKYPGAGHNDEHNAPLISVGLNGSSTPPVS